ncbi:PREDICTED: odorant receptor Or1-like [Cyphomyrmex costatus]|uniref:odorant receptor Or1-like n=1 Tax=Cyphomyrmex costatus TaxID=456900 RepID=UPI0008524647|nr:PREDICTED: odorant receptor Or1-like [Cyphomyrmex costatus]
MQILSLNFLIYTVGGIWRPVEWSSNGAKLLYNVFTFIIIFSEYFLMLTQFLDIIFVVNNVDDFATNTLMFLSIVAVCCKTTVIVVRRNAIINLVQLLLKAPYKPQDEDEVAIQTKFDKFIRSCSIKYSLLATSSVTGTTIGSVLNVMQGHLPYRIWLPCNYNVSVMFWIISTHQIITLIFATLINVGTETLVFGLILQTCAQFEIFENRLHKLIINKTVKYLGRASSLLNEDKTELSECIRHHLSIYKYAKAVNVTFNHVLFVQFFSSILVLCTSVYYLSMHIKELSAAAPLLVYTICMFVQIFVYCWSGNEVMLKSMNIADAIYRMNWPLLSTNEKKGLLMIMIRSTVPVKFTSSFLITLSLQSYSNVSFLYDSNMDPLRSQIALQMNRFLLIQNAVEDILDDTFDTLSRHIVNTRLEVLESNWNKFQAEHDRLCNGNLGHIEEASYIKHRTYERCQEFYVHAKSVLLEQQELIEASHPSSRASDTQRVDTRFNNRRSNLPRISLPTFSGDYNSWRSFHDLFMSMIGGNDELTNVKKMHYLKTCLSGDAARLVTNLKVSDATFSIAWKTLATRYENKRVLISAHLDKLLGLKPVKSKSPQELNTLMATVTESLGALEALNCNTSSWDPLLIHQLSRLLDEETRVDLEEKLGSSTTYPTLKEFEKFEEN